MQDFYLDKSPFVLGAKPRLVQILRIMKLTVLILMACIQVSANSFAQKVSLTLNNAPLKSAFEQITHQTGFRFFYNNDQLKRSRPITINIKDAVLEEALSLCFKNQPFSYSIVDQVIVINEKKVAGSINNGEGMNMDNSPIIDVKGRVLNERGDPVAEVTVTIKGTNTATSTDANGEFSLSSINRDAVLIFTHISMETFELKVSGKTELRITLKDKISALGGVEVLANTGFQTVKPNEINGSVVVVDNKMFNEQKGTNVLQRLNGVVPGIYFNVGKNNNNGNPQSTTGIMINGLSTINGPLDPLIVLDNFPYEGDINNINPNDVESITVLRDAAAASIWGPRAGNGVIVITTKKGRFNQKAKINFNSNVIVLKRPDLYSLPQMQVSDLIDIEQLIYNKGFFNSQINSASRPALPPSVEVFLKRKNGLISAADSAAQIDYLKSLDSREQYNKYFNQDAVTQQYALNLSGGSNTMSWFISGAYDKNITSIKNNENDKINLRINNFYKPLKNLQLRVGVYYTNQNSNTAAENYGYNGMFLNNSRSVSYLQFADENGDPLAVARDLRQGYTDTAGKGTLMNWKYFPLVDYLHNRVKRNQEEILGNLNVNYKLFNALDIDISYQYEKQRVASENLADTISFKARDLINRFYQRNTRIFQVPRGGIMDLSNATLKAQNLRGQLTFNKSWEKHTVSALAGAEVRDVINTGNSNRIYGYNADPLYLGVVDYVNRYANYITGAAQNIPVGSNTVSKSNYRFVSLFSNLSYTFDKRYTISGSLRKDGSNILGVKTNDKWKPLWSLGFGWEISNEKFYKMPELPYLRLRGSYGFSGNLDLRKTALPIASYGNPSGINNPFPYAVINQINNPELRWEKVGQFNIGFDFSIVRQIVAGSIEYYHKKGTDLYGQTAYDYTTWGYVNTITKNVASMEGKGVTINLQSKNIDKVIKWTSNLMFNYNSNKTKEYFSPISKTGATLIGAGNTIYPVVGKPLYAIAAYKWGGLNASGDPQGYVNRELSNDYDAIINEVNTKGLASDNVVYVGPAIPVYFGSLINEVSWKGFSVSFNIAYKLGYYFRKSSISYSSLYSSGIGHKDFENRWQKPGDEFITNVPSMVYTDYPQFSLRESFYNNSEALILKADNIRLQYINLTYTLDGKKFKLPFEQFQLNANAANLGIIWRANKENIDPDYPTTFTPSKQFAIGVRAIF